MLKKSKVLIGISIILILVIGFLSINNNKEENILAKTDRIKYKAGDTLKVKIKNNFLANISFSYCYPYFLEKKSENWKRYEYEECQKFNGNGYFINRKKEKTFETVLPEVSDGVYRMAIPICIECESNDSFWQDRLFYSNEFQIK